MLDGEETELDRSVIEEIGDPLVHMIRNSADHGIESPEARRAAGKGESGLESGGPGVDRGLSPQCPRHSRVSPGATVG